MEKIARKGTDTGLITFHSEGLWNWAVTPGKWRHAKKDQQGLPAATPAAGRSHPTE